MKQIKNNSYLYFFALILGIIISIIVFLFLTLSKVLINFLWVDLNNYFNYKYYPLILGIIGGIVIGIVQKISGGNKPKLTEEVMLEVKSNKKYKYENFFTNFFITLLPLIFGASIGPEAGLVGIIVSLCYYAKDKLKKAFHDIEMVTKTGIGVTIGIIFNAPMFGFTLPIEDDNEIKIPKKLETLLYIIVFISCFTTFFFLSHLFGSVGGIEKFGKVNISYLEILFLPLFILISYLVYNLNNFFVNFTNDIFKRIEDKYFIKAVIGGIVIGIFALILPLTLFSGEEELKDLINNYSEYSYIFLLVVGIMKLFLTNFCIKSGFRGGNIFPLIYSATAIGFAISLLTNTNVVFGALVVLTSLLVFIMKKPIAVSLLLMICFSVNDLPLLILVATITTIINNIIKRRLNT